MVSAAGDTQVLDSDPPSSDCKANDAASNEGRNEIPNLCGETQPIHGPDSDDDVASLDIWGKTQLVDAWGETAALDGGEEETTETAEVVSTDEEGSSDDEGPNCGPRVDGAIGGVEDGVSWERKKDVCVDPDASTDDEADCKADIGCIEEIPVLCGMTELIHDPDNTDGIGSLDVWGKTELVDVSGETVVVDSGGEETLKRMEVMSQGKDVLFDDGANCGPQNEVPVDGVDDRLREKRTKEKWVDPDVSTGDKAVSSCNGGHREHDNDGAAHTGLSFDVINNLRVDQMNLDNEIENLGESIQNFSKERVIGKQSNVNAKGLFNEVKSCLENEGTSEIDKIVLKEDSSHLLTSNYGGRGLIYIGSQEPGKLSQANALEVVDNYLSTDCVGSSQEARSNNTDRMSPLLVHGWKRSQILAWKMYCRIPSGRADIFDWNCGNEDEEAGGIYSRRKGSLFTGICGPKQIENNSYKPNHSISDIMIGGLDSIKEMEGTASETCEEKLQSESTMLYRCHISATRPDKKSILKDVDAGSSSLVHQLETSHADMGLDRSYVVGADTQMAVEAMEALGHTFPVNSETKDDMHPEEGILIKKSRKASRNILLEKGISTNSESMTRRYRGTKVFSMKAWNISTDSSGNLTYKAERSTKGSILAVKKKRVKQKLDNHFEIDVASAHHKRRRTNRVASKERNLNANLNMSFPSELGAKDAAENGKQEGFPCGEIQASGAPKRNAVSPFFVVQDPPRLCEKGLLEPLNSRKVRLESIEASSTPVPRDVRRKKDMASIRVLFSRHLDKDTIKQQKKILTRLGLPVASLISDATHFVTDKFVRTQDMLEAIASGKPVVTPMWLESCGQASCFIDEKSYILRDDKKEKEIGFNMSVSLSRARQCPLLQGQRVFITPNVKPNRKLITSLVKASCGQEVEKIGTSAMVLDDLLVISCEEDYSVCIRLLQKGINVFSSELLLNGIVIQKLEYERHRLFGISQHRG
ncbi:hypothetical protein Cni_G24634 [Canna indica]|uniref:BRCT domain-containing protein n=1 Tax=Canna indica TaxID=4628 RepID=A0AAQ3QND8_9LILI|nr:hypothetical protein Cni_G24634 [Canna indica]